MKARRKRITGTMTRKSIAAGIGAAMLAIGIGVPTVINLARTPDRSASSTAVPMVTATNAPTATVATIAPTVPGPESVPDVPTTSTPSGVSTGSAATPAVEPPVAPAGEAAPPADAPMAVAPPAATPSPNSGPNPELIRSLDQTGPTIEGFLTTCSYATRTVVWTIEVSDPSGVKSVSAKFKAGGVTQAALVRVVQPGVYNVTMAAPSVELVTVTATDKWGNTSTAKRTNLCVD
jgi:hypothetical protein